MDAVLLSGFAQAKKGERVMDLGTGTGIIPILMEAKTEGGHFTALEIQEASAEMAKRSVSLNGLDEKIDIDIHAANVYLSHSALIWKFRQELNTTPSQYLIHIRLRYAKHLLINTNYSITQISELCGYTNPFYFTNAFRKYTGKNPTSFREHHLNEIKITRI